VKEKLVATLSDIRFWIILSLLIRLVGITDPPIEIGHNWRQTTVTMVARNFLETDANILYPRIDIAGEKSGITGMEFPVFNYSIYLVSSLFGYQHWYGRLINLLISSLGAWFFFRLVSRFFESKVAFFATLIFLVSIWFSYSRKIMPDTFAVSLILIGMYYFSEFIHNTNYRYLTVGSVLIAFGVLSKLPAGVVLTPFVLFLFEKNSTYKKKIIILLSFFAISMPSIWWYFYWVPFLNVNFGYWHFFMGKTMSEGFQELSSNLPEFLEKFYGTSLFYLGFIACVVGVYFSIKKKFHALNWVVGISFLAIVVILLKSGQTFAHHTYYMIPFLPAMSLAAGYGLASLPYKKMSILFLVGILAEGTLNQLADFRIPPSHLSLLELESDLTLLSEKNDLIVINSGNVPTPMYFAHRKGWVESNKKIQEEQYISELEKKGLRFIVVLKEGFGRELTLPYPIVEEKKSYRIYSLH
jgi:4-amino-4-deoxy-L-arabinose transferase-like glycosyltransferase